MMDIFIDKVYPIQSTHGFAVLCLVWLYLCVCVCDYFAQFRQDYFSGHDDVMAWERFPHY